MVNYRYDLEKMKQLSQKDTVDINNKLQNLLLQQASNKNLLTKDIEQIKLANTNKVNDINVRFLQFREAIHQKLVRLDTSIHSVSDAALAQIKVIEEKTPDRDYFKKLFEKFPNTDFIKMRFDKLNKLPDKEFINNHFTDLPKIQFIKNNFDKLPTEQFVKKRFDDLPTKLFIKNNFDKLPNEQFVKKHFDDLPKGKFVHNQFQQLPKKQELVSTIQNQGNSFSYQLNHQYNRIDALFSIHNIIKLNYPLPIMNDWAISSDFAHVLATKIMSKEKPTIVDVGSGISTLISGYIAKKIGGQVISLEHNKDFFEQTNEMISNHELQDYIKLYFCPLKKYTINKKSWQWYDISKIKFPNTIDILTVDGPPGNIQINSRFPAVPILNKYITLDTTVLLDDGAREDEQEIANMWVAGFGFSSEMLKSHKGIIILQKK
ncbi:MAG TPA: class I SAM-dependent methyltransferase [Fulvivirga sp.]|nr:class I SAM-dependent methyltransferase [Fulvivirga sp.]